MKADALFAITNGQFQTDDLVWLGILTAAVVVMAGYVRKVRDDLRRTRKLLEDQAKFNAKLNETVEHILRIDREGQIDSHRRSHKKSAN
jgi:hypothetical protein